MDFESINSWGISFIALWRDECGVDLEEDVVERCTKVCSINSCVARRFGVVDILAFGTVELYCFKVWVVRLSHRQQGLRFAHHSRAFAKIILFVLLKLFKSQKVP